MGQTQTAFLILGIIVVLGFIAYTIQLIEERKRARKLLIMSLKSQIRNALNIYKGIPDTFMTNELHNFISRFILAKWKRLHDIYVTEDSERSLISFKEKIKDKKIFIQSSTATMSIYQSEGQVHHALAQLRVAKNWLAELNRSRNINESDFNQLGWQLKDSFDRVACDVQILHAKQTENDSGDKAGFFKFKIALKALKNLNQSESLDSQIFEIHKHMEQLMRSFEERELAEETARQALQDDL